MNREIVDRVVNAVLYEGYILYPYRASSKKNQRERFTFGRIYPDDYAVAQQGREPSFMQTECLLRDESKDAIAHVEIRFLHPMAREIGVLHSPVNELSENEEPAFDRVPEFGLEGKLHQAWHEAIERQIIVPPFSVGASSEQRHEFYFPASRTLEPIRGAAGKIAALMVRQQERIEGKIEIATQRLDGAVKLTVRVLNRTAVPAPELEDQAKIIMRTFASAHTLIWTEGGECLSLLDPPPQYEVAARACKNIGCWPVLVGDETKNERDAILSSPIILYDYPKIAPESAGNLFDGTEIDEILTLRIQTMTDEEKAEMRNVDEHARRILERTELMPNDHLLQMHGTMRDVRSSAQDFFNPAERRQMVTVNGVELKAGDRVRIRPKRRADAFDMILSGKIAIIEAIEEDVQNEVHLALVLEDDPGRELGMARQPGHRFFYGLDEVEPVAMTKSE
ncbi:MAG: hypothetical protein ACR2FX_08475 [Chthoniobacterales bacterium]